MFDNSKKIIVVGDLMIDRYWFGETKRISQEAPIPIVDMKKEEFRPGGAANVALNIRELGFNTTLYGLTGNDSNSETLYKLLFEKNINLKFLKTNSETITKLRILSKGNQIARIDFEKPFKLKYQNELLKIWNENNLKEDLLIISDYAKGTVNAENWIKKAIKKNIPVLVDPKGSSFDKYSNATCITPNLKEFKNVVGEANDINVIVEKALNVLKSFSIKSILITMSEHGMVLVKNSGHYKHYKSKAVQVNDVTGAGDTVIASFGAAMISGFKIEDAAKIANQAAGVVVSKIGTSPIKISDFKS